MIHGGVPHHQIEPAARLPVPPGPVEQVRERQLPVVEPPLPGELIHEPEPRKLLEQLLQVQHPDLVGDPLRDVCGVLGVGVVVPEQAPHLRSDLRVVHRSGQHQADLVQEILLARQPLGLADRPEPERAPVVHHQLQPPVGARRARPLTHHPLGADAVLP